MPRKTLENLTFTLLKATTAVEEAEELVMTLPTLQNKIILCEAEEVFETARIELSAALGPTSIVHYMKGIQEVAGRATGRAAKSIEDRKAHRLFIEIEE